MDRDIPSFNRPIMQRIYQKNHQLHLKRLKKIKNSISSNKSYQRPSYNNLSNSNSITATNYTKLPQYNDVKKQLQQEQKRTEIQRENALLFNKMIKIMKRPDKNNDPAGGVKQHPTVNAAKQRISMEFSRINQENKTFYHRLEKQKPTIDHRKLQEERLKNLNILKFLGKYPNQQAISRVSSSVASNHNFTGQRQKRNQFNTYQLRNKKMNSTTSGDNYYNQIRFTQGQGNTLYSTNGHNFSYRNQDQGSYLQDQRQKYNKFRSQITNFDNEFRELKNQQRRMNQNHNQSIGREEGEGNYQTRSGNKFVSTMGNFHQSNQNNSFRHNMPKIPTLPKPNPTNYTTHLPFMKPQGQTSNFNYQQPSIPSRRKFLSQGANRTRNSGMHNTAYNNNPNMMMASYNSQQQNNHMNTNQQSLFTGGQQTVQQQNGATQHVEMPYPYYLNHPSNNIIIEDMNRQSIESKQKAKMNKASNQQPPLPYKPQKQQRKLNKRNSQSNLNDFQGSLVDRTAQNNNLTTFVQKTDQNLKRFMTNSHNNGHNNKSIQSSQKRNVHNEYYEVDGQEQPVPKFAKNNTRQKSHSSNHVQEHKNFVRSSKHVQQKQMNGSLYKNDLIQQAYQNPPPKKPYFVNQNPNKSQSKNSNSVSKNKQSNKGNPNLKGSINKSSKKNINPLENQSSQFQKSNNSNIQSSGQNITTIILYKTSVKLSSLLLPQQNELIVEYMFRQFHSNQQFSTNQQLQDTYLRLGSILTNSLQQYSTQVTIFRQNKSYNIKTTKFTKQPINKRHPHPGQSLSHNHQPSATQVAYQKQVQQYIHRFVQQMFGNIQPMQIPQNQGSVLLEEIDYDYKYLVKEMVKIEKEQDQQQESHGTNNENKRYKLVIVLKNQEQQQQDKQPDWSRDQDDKVLESETHIKNEEIKENNNTNNNHNNINNNIQPPSQLNIHFNRSNQQQQQQKKQQQPHQQQQVYQNETNINNNTTNNQNPLNRHKQQQQQQLPSNSNNNNINTANTNNNNNNFNNNNNNNINFYQADEQLVD